MRRLAPLLLLVVACHTAAASSTVVELDEFRITSSVATLRAGEVDVTVRNQGAFGHTLVVTDANGEVVAAADLLEPAEEAEVSLDLAPGTYQLTCRIVGQDGDGNLVDHFERGMLATVVVEPADSRHPDA